MKKIIPLFLLSLLFCMATDAQVQECCVDAKNYYAKIFGGVNRLQTTDSQGVSSTYQPGYIFAGSLGYCWCYGLSVEAEYAYRRNEIRKSHFSGRPFSMHHGHFQSSSYMANLLWNLPLCSWGCTFWNMQPFIGAGIGYDFQHFNSTNSGFINRQHWNHFSWQLMAGVAYPIYCNTEMTFEYKYHQGGCHFNHHSLGVGLVYKFSL